MRNKHAWMKPVECKLSALLVVFLYDLCNSDRKESILPWALKTIKTLTKECSKCRVNTLALDSVCNILI